MKTIPWWELRSEAKKRLKQRRVVGKLDIQPQTYRITATLECGHRFSYTMNERRFRSGAGNTGPKRVWCDTCLEIEAKRLMVTGEVRS